MLLTGNDSAVMAQVTEFLSTHFKVKALGDLSYFLGIHVVKTTMGLFTSQAQYTADILKDFAYLQGKKAMVPVDQHHDLLDTTDSPLLQDLTSYRHLVGRLINLTISRPDLAYSVHVLAQDTTAPRSAHWHAALKLVRYLFLIASQGLLYAFSANLVRAAFGDADWGSYKFRLSLIGYFVIFGGTLVSWKFRKQHTISRSSTKQNIATWLILVVSSPGWFLCYMSYTSLILLPYHNFVIISLLFTLLLIQCFKNKPSTLRLTVTWFVKNSNLGLFLHTMFPLMSNLQTSLLKLFVLRNWRIFFPSWELCIRLLRNLRGMLVNTSPCDC